MSESEYCKCIPGACEGLESLDISKRCGRNGKNGYALVAAKSPAFTGRIVEPKKHSHYYKDVRHLDTIDVYRVLQLFGVTDPCLQHAAKKVMFAGTRGAKDMNKDVQEAIDSLTRWIDMRAEEARAK